MSSSWDSFVLSLIDEQRIEQYLASLNAWVLDDRTLAALLVRILRVVDARRPGVVSVALREYQSNAGMARW